MKINSLILAAAMVFGFAACNEDDGVDNSTREKSVEVNLSNVNFGARSTGDKFEDGKNVALDNIYVLFSDGTSFYKSGQEDVEYYFETIPQDAPVFHLLPAEVSEVVVIGNVSAELKGELDKSAIRGYADLKGYMDAQIENQQTVSIDVTNLIVYGKKEIVPANNGDEHGNNYFTASVEIAPLVARVEIHQFQFTPGETPAYTSLELNRLAINNYNAVATFGDNGEYTFENLVNETINSHTALPYFAGLGKDVWSNDFLSITLDATQIDKYEFPGNAIRYYNVFPPYVAQLALQLDADGQPTFLATTKLKNEQGEEISEFKRGYIYTVNFDFTESDLKRPDKCIEVTVTSTPWKVVAVTPEF